MQLGKQELRERLYLGPMMGDTQLQLSPSAPGIQNPSPWALWRKSCQATKP